MSTQQQVLTPSLLADDDPEASNAAGAAGPAADPDRICLGGDSKSSKSPRRRRRSRLLRNALHCAPMRRARIALSPASSGIELHTRPVPHRPKIVSAGRTGAEMLDTARVEATDSDLVRGRDVTLWAHRPTFLRRCRAALGPPDDSTKGGGYSTALVSERASERVDYMIRVGLRQIVRRLEKSVHLLYSGLSIFVALLVVISSIDPHQNHEDHFRSHIGHLCHCRLGTLVVGHPGRLVRPSTVCGRRMVC